MIIIISSVQIIESIEKIKGNFLTLCFFDKEKTYLKRNAVLELIKEWPVKFKPGNKQYLFD